MSIQTALLTARQRIAAAYTAIENKGGTLSSVQNLANMPDAINSIPSGTSYIDLSMRGVDGQPLSARETANCYVVREAGFYKIPLIYGAAIKNGLANAAAYTNQGKARQADFVNPYGEVITSPYIESETHQAVNVEICFADEQNAVTELGIRDGNDCRYIYFRVPSVPPQGANAIIEILDASNKVMWSFHIWLWQPSLAPVTFTHWGGDEFHAMPVNLATKMDADLVHMKNWFYQWGRPNPMPCTSAYNKTTNHTLYGAKTYTTQAADTVAAALANPNKFIKANTDERWFNQTQYYNFWNADLYYGYESDISFVSIKTVYDPCPVGWKVPCDEAFASISTDGETHIVGPFNNGWKLMRNLSDTVGVFFPATFYRISNTGKIYKDASSETLYFYSTIDNYKGLPLTLWLDIYSIIDSADFHMAMGCCIRPVLDI